MLGHEEVTWDAIADLATDLWGGNGKRKYVPCLQVRPVRGDWRDAGNRRTRRRLGSIPYAEIRTEWMFRHTDETGRKYTTKNHYRKLDGDWEQLELF